MYRNGDITDLENISLDEDLEVRWFTFLNKVLLHQFTLVN